MNVPSVCRRFFNRSISPCLLLTLFVTMGDNVAIAIPSPIDTVRTCKSPCNLTGEQPLVGWYRVKPKPRTDRWTKPNVRPRVTRPRKQNNTRKRRQTVCVFHQEFQTALGHSGNGTSMFTLDLRNACDKAVRWLLCVNKTNEGKYFTEGTIGPRSHSSHTIMLRQGQNIRYRYNYCTGVACYPSKPDC